MFGYSKIVRTFAEPFGKNAHGGSSLTILEKPIYIGLFGAFSACFAG